MSELDCRAQRQLNPFSGALQVVSLELARAFSANGVVWQVQVLSERPGHTWRSESDSPSAQQYFNWGVWTQQAGLRQVPANPLMDIGAMSRTAEALIAHLPEQLPHMPFGLCDRFEHWCCDAQGMPIALLASRCEVPEQTLRPIPWQAFLHRPAPRHQARSGQLSSATAELQSQTKLLEQRVRERAPKRLWFERQADGSGLRLDNQQMLAAQHFPELGLTEDWPDGEQALWQTYLQQLAPLLLTLPLSQARRAELERMALAQATLVDDLHRLYPAIADPALLEQARVQARLQRSR